MAVDVVVGFRWLWETNMYFAFARWEQSSMKSFRKTKIFTVYNTNLTDMSLYNLTDIWSVICVAGDVLVTFSDCSQPQLLTNIKVLITNDIKRFQSFLHFFAIHMWTYWLGAANTVQWDWTVELFQWATRKVTAVLVEHALQHATREEELARLRTKEPRTYGRITTQLGNRKNKLVISNGAGIRDNDCHVSGWQWFVGHMMK